MRLQFPLILASLTVLAAPTFADDAPPLPPLPPAFAFSIDPADGQGGDQPRVIIRRADGVGTGMRMSFDEDEWNPRMLERMADDLALTPQQRGKLTEHMATHRPEMRKLREEMQQARQALREINPGDAKYDSSVNATAKQVGELSAKMVKESAVLRAKVWGELTPAQRSQLAEREARMKDRAKNIRERLGNRAGNDGEGRRIREIRIERQQRN
jgi:Spy/CpxP family protein refolding chaperone